MMLTIVVDHFEFFGSDAGTSALVTGNFYDRHFHNAGMAVVYFFLLSGFGLTYSAFLKGKQPLLGPWTLTSGYMYAKQKVSKLWKWYLLTMAIGVPLETYQVIEHRGILNGAAAIGIKALMSLTLLQAGTGYDALSHAFNGVCWFLSCLFIIYIFYPLLYKANTHFQGNLTRIVMGIVAVSGIYAVLHIVFRVTDEQLPVFNDFAYGSPYVRVWQFFFGILLCDLYLYIKRTADAARTARIFAKLEWLTVVVFIVWYLQRNNICYGDLVAGEAKGILDMLIAAMIQFVFAFESGRVSRLLQGDRFVLLGNLAMYIFLTHYPIRMSGYAILNRTFGAGILTNLMTVALTIVGTAALTARMYMSDRAHTKSPSAKPSTRKSPPTSPND